MSETTSGYSLSDIAAMVNNGGNNGGMNWNSPMWLIWAMLFGGGGFGGWGNNRNTTAEAMSTANIDMNAKLNQLSQQISDNQATNTLNSGITANHEYQHGIQESINMGFAGTQSAILNQTNQLQSRVDQLANGVAQGFAQVGYAQALQTNELNTNLNSQIQSVKDMMCQNTQQELRDKILTLSQEAQTATIVGSLKSSCGCNS